MNKLTIIGIDLAKDAFSLIAASSAGKVLWRKDLRRRRLLSFVAKLEPCHIAMEACAGAHYWAREFLKCGHTVSLLPPQYVKAYQRGQKNNPNDAFGIVEAARHSSIRPVRIKTVEEQDAQLFDGVHRQLIRDQTRLINQVRALLAEYGIVIRKGVAPLYKAVPQLLEDGENGLTPQLRLVLYRQYQRLLGLREERGWYEHQITTQSRQDEVCRRLMEVPGLGPLNSNALKGWLGDALQFKRGREASAALGIVPKQHSTGDHQHLLGITKRGNRYVRSSVIHGCRSVVQHAKNKTDPLSQWVNRLVATRGTNKATVALANKVVRIAWVIVARGEHYQPRATA